MNSPENHNLATRLRKARYAQSKRECTDDHSMALARTLGKLDADIEAMLNADDPQQYVRNIVAFLEKEPE